MTTDTWVTVVAYDTPFLAQMVADRLDEVDIANRTLSDSAGGNLPHISFGSGGYRVQVADHDESAARDVIAAPMDDVMDHLDVGDFDGDPDGVVPDSSTPDGPAAYGLPRWVKVGAVVVIAIIVGAFVIGPGDLLPRLINWPPLG
jgi:hypothetical protein